MKILEILCENRAEFIAQKQGPRLLQAYHEDLGRRKPKDIKEPIDVLAYLVKADPTQNQQYLQWIANRYIKNEFSLEDLGRVKGDIIEFDQNKATLEHKDINAYNIPKLLAAIQSRKATTKATGPTRPDFTPTQKALFANGEAQMVYEDPQIAIFIPKTANAAKKFQECLVSGGKIRWCTTQTEHHTSYSKQGPLYIVVTPTEMSQFHFESGQFMDLNDNPAELGPLAEKYPKIAEVFHKLAEEHGVLAMMKNPTQKALGNAVAKDPRKIKDIKPSQLTPELIKTAFDKMEKYNVKEIFGYVMKVRPDLVDEEVKVLVVKANPTTIKDIPKDQLTQVYVDAAVKGKASEDVVEAFRYIEKNRHDLITDKVRTAVLHMNGSLLEEIGKKATLPMVKAALSDKQIDQALTALRYAMKNIPDKVTDEDLISIVGRSRYALKEIPEDRQLPPIVYASLDHDPGSFIYIMNPTPQQVEDTIAAGPFMLKDMKHMMKHVTTEALTRVAEKSPKHFIHELEIYDSRQHLPAHIDMGTVYSKALEKAPTALQYIQKNQKPEWIKTAVMADPTTWKYANKEVIASNKELAAMYKKHKG